MSEGGSTGTAVVLKVRQPGVDVPFCFLLTGLSTSTGQVQIIIPILQGCCEDKMEYIMQKSKTVFVSLYCFKTQEISIKM